MQLCMHLGLGTAAFVNGGCKRGACSRMQAEQKYAGYISSVSVICSLAHLTINVCLILHIGSNSTAVYAQGMCAYEIVVR